TNVLDAPAPHTTRIRIDATSSRPPSWEIPERNATRFLSAPAEHRASPRDAPWTGIMGNQRTQRRRTMSRQRQDQLLQALLRQDDWATAASLADVLGVTPRSIR